MKKVEFWEKETTPLLQREQTRGACAPGSCEVEIFGVELTSFAS
jgi:hypothetical protein